VDELPSLALMAVMVPDALALTLASRYGSVIPCGPAAWGKEEDAEIVRMAKA
jgi:hypothetical protein